MDFFLFYGDWRWYIRHPGEFFSVIWSGLVWAWQRVFRGWDDRVIWAIDQHLSEVVPEWLEAIHSRKYGIPGACFEDITDDSPEAMKAAEEKWDSIISDMIAGFEAANTMIVRWYMLSEEKHKELEEIRLKGMNLFVEYYFSLWD